MKYIDLLTFYPDLQRWTEEAACADEVELALIMAEQNAARAEVIGANAVFMEICGRCLNDGEALNTVLEDVLKTINEHNKAVDDLRDAIAKRRRMFFTVVASNGGSHEIH